MTLIRFSVYVTHWKQLTVNVTGETSNKMDLDQTIPLRNDRHYESFAHWKLRVNTVKLKAKTHI